MGLVAWQVIGRNEPFRVQVVDEDLPTVVEHEGIAVAHEQALDMSVHLDFGRSDVSEVQDQGMVQFQPVGPGVP